MRRLALACVLAASAAASGGAQQHQGDIGLTAARFYRAGAAQTLFDVFCRIPLSLIARLDGTAGRGVYRFAVSVRDSSGLQLVAQAWTGTVSPELIGVSGALTTEHFGFAVPAGRYTVQVALTDSATGQVTSQRADVSAFDRPPPASDVLLASNVRRAASAADSEPRAGEIRKGGVFLETSGRPVLTPDRSRLGYYVELYSARAESVTATVRVRSAAGREMVAASPQRIAVSAGGGATQGVVDLGGLPPGDYRLELAVATPDSEVMRSGEFGMAGFETVKKIAELPRPEPADTFAAVDETHLDSLYEPLAYLMKPEEAGVFSGLTVDGKRGYLRRFWATRNPTAGAAPNEAMERFYAYVRDANRRFGEGGASRVAGWRTDRGRIFIKNGPPDEVLSRPQSGSTQPYEVWKYTRGRSRKYIFMDLRGFGNYTLIWTDDHREPTLPNWSVLLGTEATVDAFRF